MANKFVCSNADIVQLRASPNDSGDVQNEVDDDENFADVEEPEAGPTVVTTEDGTTNVTSDNGRLDAVHWYLRDIGGVLETVIGRSYEAPVTYIH